MTGNYVDESKIILEELGLDEETDEEEVESGDDDGSGIQVCKWLFLCVFYSFYYVKHTIKLRKNDSKFSWIRH